MRCKKFGTKKEKKKRYKIQQKKEEKINKSAKRGQWKQGKSCIMTEYININWILYILESKRKQEL